jgi:cobalt-zinc-cadmium resistance protein CzcA
VKIEQTTGLPMLTVNIDRQKTARYGLNVSDIQDTIATAIGGWNAVPGRPPIRYCRPSA